MMLDAPGERALAAAISARPTGQQPKHVQY